MRIGVLALQGAFIEHINMLNKMGIDSFEIRQKKDLEKDFDGLIIPGGESTVISNLLKSLDMWNLLEEKIKNGLYVFGTCAGLIILGNEHLKLIDIDVVRNAYGRQLGSFKVIDKFDNKDVEMVFIRAPYIKNANSNVKILSVVDSRIVAARNNNILVTAFHPELTNSTYVHQYFIDMIKGV